MFLCRLYHHSWRRSREISQGSNHAIILLRSYLWRKRGYPTKGQVILSKGIRDARAWGPGTEFTVEETGDGVLLRSAGYFAKSDLDAVAGCLRFHGKPKTTADMRKAIAKEVMPRHGRGRH